LWADARYFRDPISISPHLVVRSPLQILKLACIADILDYPDYSLELLAHLTLHYGSEPLWNYAEEIKTILSEFPDLVEQGLESLPIFQQIQPFLSQGR
jgi:hypothetical protein